MRIYKVLSDFKFQASVDVLAELGYLSSCMMMMTLLQCIKSARWPTDHPFSIFPGVKTENVVDKASHPPHSPRSLVDIPSLWPDSLQKLMESLAVPVSDRPSFLRAARMLPHLGMSVPDSSTSALQIVVSLTRQNDGRFMGNGPPSSSSSLSSVFRVWAPRFPKPQTEGFFVIVADEKRDEVIALKRVGWPLSPCLSASASNQRVEDIGQIVGGERGRGGKGRGRGSGRERERDDGRRPSVRVVLKIPQSDRPRHLDVIVVSDAYVGMQWRLEAGLDVPPAPTFYGVGGDDGNGKGKLNV